MNEEERKVYLAKEAARRLDKLTMMLLKDFHFKINNLDETQCKAVIFECDHMNRRNCWYFSFEQRNVIKKLVKRRLLHLMGCSARHIAPPRVGSKNIF